MTQHSNNSGPFRTDERWDAVDGPERAAIRARKYGLPPEERPASQRRIGGKLGMGNLGTDGFSVRFEHVLDRVCARLLERATGGRLTFVGDRVISRGGTTQ